MKLTSTTPCPKPIPIGTGIQQPLHSHELNVMEKYTYHISISNESNVCDHRITESVGDTYQQPPLSSITDSVAAQVPLRVSSTPAKVVQHRNAGTPHDSCPAKVSNREWKMQHIRETKVWLCPTTRHIIHAKCTAFEYVLSGRTLMINHSNLGTPKFIFGVYAVYGRFHHCLPQAGVASTALCGITLIVI